MLSSINPFTQKLTAQYGPHTRDEIEHFLQASNEAQKAWRSLSFAERGEYLLRVADIMSQKKDELAKISTEEMGMLLTDARSDIEKTVTNIRTTVQMAQSWLAPRSHLRGVVEYSPLGTILVIAPWNYPYNQALRNTVPQLMAGNCVILKHASNLPGVSLALQEVFDEAGLPAGVFRSLLVRGSDTEALISDPRIAGVAITAGDRAGRAVGAAAGRALKPSLLELGGNDPCIVLPDASDEEAIKIILKGRLANGGQKCNAIKRLILIGDRLSLIEKLIQEFSSQKLGDPTDPETQTPPLVDASSVAEIADMVHQSVSAGARVLVGGEMVALGDALRPQFYLPTLLTDISPENPAYDYEFFGPVLTLHIVSKVEEAIVLANDSRYGLGAVVVGHDLEQIDLCTRSLRVGNIAINQPVTSYPDLPYGGIGDSGYGREMGPEGIHAFMNVKVVIQ